jgi:hypothetical protein
MENEHVSARFLRWQYAHGWRPSHFTFLALHKSHAAVTLSRRLRFGVLPSTFSVVSMGMVGGGASDDEDARKRCVGNDITAAQIPSRNGFLAQCT